MPPSSKAQARFMRGVAAGTIKAPGLSKKQALEYVRGTPTHNLPARAKKRSAPLPAANVSAVSVPAPQPGKAMMQTISQVSGLSRLRTMRLKSSGGFQP